MANFKTLLVVLILTIGFALRFYNFENRLIYGPEQAMSFLTSAGNLEKISLLGESYIQRQTSAHHTPFHDAYFSYLILPTLVLSNFHVLPITFLFLLLNLFTGYILFKVTRKIFNFPIAIFSLIYFTFSSTMIHHSLFEWILNLLPLLGILTIYWLHELLKDRSRLRSVFLLGFASMFGFGLQVLYLPFAFAAFVLAIILSKNRFKSLVVFLVGAILGGLPTIIFDIRHDFYYTRTLWQFFIDVFANKTVSGGSDYYNYLHLYPIKILCLALLTFVSYKIYKPSVIIIISLFIYLNIFNSPMVDLNRSTGMVEGMTLKNIEKATAIIANDKPQDFNVVTLWDFDTRAHTLRYILKYYYKLDPMGVEEYPKAKTIYAFAPKDYQIEDASVWELSSFAPYDIKPIWDSQTGHTLYKLSKK